MNKSLRYIALLAIIPLFTTGLTTDYFTEKEGFDNTNFDEPKTEVEILSLIDEIAKIIQDSQIDQSEKDSITGKLSKLKDRLEI